MKLIGSNIGAFHNSTGLFAFPLHIHSTKGSKIWEIIAPYSDKTFTMLKKHAEIYRNLQQWPVIQITWDRGTRPLYEMCEQEVGTPGIGLVTAMHFLTETEDISGFDLKIPTILRHMSE